MARHKRTFHKILSNLSKVLSLILWLADRKLSPRAREGGVLGSIHVDFDVGVDTIYPTVHYGPECRL